MGKLAIRLVWDQETAGSRPAIPTKRKGNIVASVVLRLNFDEFTEKEEYQDSIIYHKYYNLKSLQKVSSDIPDSAIYGIQETLAQSDRVYIDLPAALVEALGSDEEYEI